MADKDKRREGPPFLEDFLYERGVADSVISYIRREKIDCRVISLMTEEELKRLFESYGDRIAVADFCKRQTNPLSQRKNSLLDRLRQKMSIKKKRSSRASKSSSDEDEPSHRNEKKRIKPDRLSEIGWLHSEDGKTFKQIRTCNGGGTRKIRVLKTSTKEQLMEEGKNLFFPNGKSAKGLKMSSLKIDIMDFAGNRLGEDMNVDDMFQKAKLSKLKVYLSSQKREKCETVTSGAYDADLESPSMTCTNLSGGIAHNQPKKSNINNNSISDTLPDLDGSVDDFQFSQRENTSVDLDNTYSFPYDLVEFLRPRSCREEISEGQDEFLTLAGHREEIPEEQQNTRSETPSSPVLLILHRGQVFEELLEKFSSQNMTDCHIQIQLVLPNGEYEAGSDLGGVWRDTLSEFWGTMFDKCTVGTNVKVPRLRHDFGKEKWTAMANIFKHGWKSDEYLPIKLSKVFIEKCIFKKKTTKRDLTSEFLEFISDEEKDTLSRALKSYSDVEEDDLIEILSNYDCKVLPSEDNLPKIVEEIADKVLIQETAFVANCFNVVLNNLMTEEKFEEVYRNRKPSSKNIISLFQYESTNSAEEDRVVGYLKKFIRESNENGRMSFLRFCTGADICIGHDIKITFNHLSGFQRSPVAHTCSCTLEIPLTYDDYLEFRSEFQSVLNSNIWIVNIV